MNRPTSRQLLALAGLALGILYFFHDTAEARIGRGRSFGSKPSYQRSAPPPAQQPAPARPAPTTQPGPGASPMGRGGMLGGLLMGGLIGSLLFGGHAAGGPGLLDLLVIGGGVFLLLRFLRARRTAAAAAGAGGMTFEGAPGQAWGQSGYTPGVEAAAVPAPALPPGFDADEFLKGARAIYARLQSAWDRRDLEDIRQFTSPEVFAEIQRQAAEDAETGKTELLLVNPSIVEVREEDRQTVASVLYDVMMREPGDPRARQVRELWHFSREAGRPEVFWVLEGIQQIEQ